MADITITDAPDPEKTSWPFRVMLGALVVSLFCSAFVLPPAEGLEIVRDLLYVAFVAGFLIRWRLAVLRHEHSRSWLLYLVLILVAPLIVFLAEPILKAL